MQDHAHARGPVQFRLSIDAVDPITGTVSLGDQQAPERFSGWTELMAAILAGDRQQRRDHRLVVDTDAEPPRSPAPRWLEDDAATRRASRYSVPRLVLTGRPGPDRRSRVPLLGADRWILTPGGVVRA